MKCAHFGKSPAIHGITLLRQNPTGQAGVWACESCNRKPIPDDLAQSVAEIQHAMKEPIA